METLLDKVEVATVLGTLQSMLVDFKFIGEEWIRNTREERLLGVSLTGIYDNETMAGFKGHNVLAEWLNAMRDHARAVNAVWAEKLGITPSTAITCVDFCALGQ